MKIILRIVITRLLLSKGKGLKLIKSAKIPGPINGTQLCMLSGGAMADVDEIVNATIEFVAGLSDEQTVK